MPHDSGNYLTFQADLSNPETVSAYDEVPLWSALFGLLLLRNIPLGPNWRVLDVGCGTGFPTLELAQRLGASCEVVGIDPWEAALARAKRKAKIWGVRNATFLPERAEKLSFADSSFDLIVSNLGLNNFANAEAAVAECWRVAKPGAKVALTTNLQGHMAEFYEVFDSTLRKLGLTRALEDLQAHVRHRATVESVSSLLQNAGFHVLRVLTESQPIRFADGSALLQHYFIKLGFLEAWKKVVPPSDQEAVFERIEAALNAEAMEKGGLVLRIPMAYVEAERPKSAGACNHPVSLLL